ncbi:MAG: C2 family cysteine protease [Candidatus Sericytochromatia bacterium]
MDLQTQNYLRGCGGSKGISYKGLKSLDTDKDGKLSGFETCNQISTQDLKTINIRLQVYREALEPLPFIDDDTIAFSRAELNSSLFPNGIDGINVNDIQQGGLGDCYFLAALASLAKSRPSDIISMITDRGNGTYSVKFPGAKYAVTISDSDPGWAGSGYDRNNQYTGSTWVSVLEKAFVAYVMKEDTGTAKTMVSNAADTLLGIVSPMAWLTKKAINTVAPARKDPQEYFKWGGLQGQGISILTGHSSDDDVLSLTRNSTIRSKLKSHLAKGDLVTASTFKSGSESHNLQSDHVYSVLAYDERADVLTLRNPHGTYSDATGLTYADGQDDGVFKMTLDEFNSYFTFIGYENH